MKQIKIYPSRNFNENEGEKIIWTWSTLSMKSALKLISLQIVKFDVPNEKQLWWILINYDRLSTLCWFELNCPAGIKNFLFHVKFMSALPLRKNIDTVKTLMWNLKLFPCRNHILCYHQSMSIKNLLGSTDSSKFKSVLSFEKPIPLEKANEKCGCSKIMAQLKRNNHKIDNCGQNTTSYTLE